MLNETEVNHSGEGLAVFLVKEHRFMTVFLETILSFLAALCKPIEGKAQGIGF